MVEIERCNNVGKACGSNSNCCSGTETCVKGDEGDGACDLIRKKNQRRR